MMQMPKLSMPAKKRPAKCGLVALPSADEILTKLTSRMLWMNSMQGQQWDSEEDMRLSLIACYEAEEESYRSYWQKVERAHYHIMNNIMSQERDRLITLRKLNTNEEDEIECADQIYLQRRSTMTHNLSYEQLWECLIGGFQMGAYHAKAFRMDTEGESRKTIQIIMEKDWSVQYDPDEESCLNPSRSLCRGNLTVQAMYSLILEEQEKEG